MVDSGVPRWKDLPEVYSGFRCSWDYFNSLPSKAGKIDQLGTVCGFVYAFISHEELIK
jgi:hypothetical protein